MTARSTAVQSATRSWTRRRGWRVHSRSSFAVVAPTGVAGRASTIRPLPRPVGRAVAAPARSPCSWRLRICDQAMMSPPTSTAMPPSAATARGQLLPLAASTATTPQPVGTARASATEVAARGPPPADGPAPDATAASGIQIQVDATRSAYCTAAISMPIRDSAARLTSPATTFEPATTSPTSRIVEASAIIAAPGPIATPTTTRAAKAPSVTVGRMPTSDAARRPRTSRRGRRGSRAKYSVRSGSDAAPTSGTTIHSPAHSRNARAS